MTRSRLCWESSDEEKMRRLDEGGDRCLAPLVNTIQRDLYDQCLAVNSSPTK